jgi:hypothetical protein
MHVHGELFAVFAMWLALMTVLSVWVVRISTLLHRQRRAEIAYRMQLAAAMGTAVRDLGSGSASAGARPQIVQPR